MIFKIKLINHLLVKTDSLVAPAATNYLHTQLSCSDYYRRPIQPSLRKFFLKEVDCVMCFEII